MNLPNRTPNHTPNQTPDRDALQAVIAYIRPEAEARVLDAVRALPGVTGATAVDGRGFGRGRRQDVAVDEVVYGTASVVRLEVMVRAAVCDTVVRAIREAAHTGHRGDGKVYVVPLARATRISTGEEGESAT